MRERLERRREDARPDGAPRAEPPVPVERVLALQRGVGNRRVASLLAARRGLSRYVVTDDYSFGAGEGERIALQSHGLEHGTGTYTRTTTSVGGEGLETRREAYDPGSRTWSETRRGPAAARPALKVSAGGRIAVETAGQARLVYLDNAVLADSNARLKAASSRIQLVPTAMTVTFPHGVPGRAGSFTLRQASIARSGADVPEELGGLEQLNLDAVRLQVECHDIAKEVMAEEAAAVNPPTAPHAEGAGRDRAADPNVGQAFHYKTAGGGAFTPLPFDSTKAGWSAWWNNRPRFDSVMQELEHIDGVLAAVGEGHPLTAALQGAGGLSGEAKGFLPGWGDHSEGVVARDGADALTLANYNRQTEANWIIGRVVRDAYRQSKPFRTSFQNRYFQFVAKQPNAGDIDAEMFAGMLTYCLADIQNYLQALGLDALVRRVRDSANQLGQTLWYFELYGAEDQSFHAQYQTLASRGQGGGATTVVGHAAVPAEMV